MIRRLAFRGWLFALTLVIPAVVAGADERLLVVHMPAMNTVELIDLTTSRSLATTTVGWQTSAIAVTPDRRYGLVAAIGVSSISGNVSVLDINAPGMPVVAIVSSSRCFDVAVTPDSKTAIVARSHPSTPQLQLVDLSSTPPRDSGNPIAIPKGRGTANVAVSLDGRTAYVTDGTLGMLSVFDLTRSPPVAVRQLATGPHGGNPTLSNDGSRLIINSTAGYGIWNATTPVPSKIGPLANGLGASGPSFDPGNRFAVATTGLNLGSVLVFDPLATPPTTLGIVHNLASDLWSTAVTTDGLAAWISANRTKALLEIDLSNPSRPAPTRRAIPVTHAPGTVIVFGEVHAHGVPAIGTTYPIYVSSPPHAGKAYMLGASSGSRPGFQAGRHRIRLNPDPLFALSQTVPAIFRKFAGVLNTQGQAAAAIAIPPAPTLRGFSFVVAGIILDPNTPGGIAVATNAERIVVQ